MEKITIPKEIARDLLDGPMAGDEYELIDDTQTDNTRWSILHTVIFRRTADGAYFQSYYSVGATEMQDESPWEYEDAQLTPVLPVEKTVIVYEPVA